MGWRKAGMVLCICSLAPLGSWAAPAFTQGRRVEDRSEGCVAGRGGRERLRGRGGEEWVPSAPE